MYYPISNRTVTLKFLSMQKNFLHIALSDAFYDTQQVYKDLTVISSLFGKSFCHILPNRFLRKSEGVQGEKFLGGSLATRCQC